MIAKFRMPGVTDKVMGGFLILALIAVGLTDAGAGRLRGDNPAAPQTQKKELAVNVALKGVCEDESGKALSGVRVFLYREDRQNLKDVQFRNLETGADGRFEFRDLPPISKEESDAGQGYLVAATKPGRGSAIRRLSTGFETEPLKLSMKPAATLKGRVTGPDGKPVAGAQVWPNGYGNGPLEGVCSARSDGDGRYAITDMTAWGPDVHKPIDKGNGIALVIEGCYFNVLHPDFAHEVAMYRNMPDTVDVILQPAGVVAGRVVDRVTGKPAAGASVFMQGTHGNNGWGRVGTAVDGSYRITSVKAGKYNICVDVPNRVCAALDSIEVEAGKTYSAPDLSLVEGSWLEGQLVDAVTGKPISFESKDVKPSVGLYGPSRPKSGAACQYSIIDSQGRFRLHVAPGINYPYLMDSDYNSRIQRGNHYFEKGIEVKAGEVVSIEFRILPTKPIPDPEPSAVRLAIPVEAERESAATIRRLGGWYKVDAENHVVEVNMVDHVTAEKRFFHNTITNTDEALRSVGSFPRLKGLYLQKGQATDEGLKTLSKLIDLEVLFVLDAERITDQGIADLAGLKKLKSVCLESSKLTGDSLAVFGQLPAIEELSLQGNSIDDDGLKHLANIKGLRSLWVGRNKAVITDKGARHLANLTEMKELDLQGANLTDEGVIALKELKQLRRLDVSTKSGAITDACIESLLEKPKLTSLSVIGSQLTDKGVERLLALKDLKDLSLGTIAMSRERQEELKKQRPGLRLWLFPQE